jgi:DNA-3-methyladenine glycosylase II
LRDLIRRIGPCTLQHNPDHFSVLVRSIISQQISTRAALAIGGRLVTALGRLTPRTILGASDDTLRQAGLSANKARSLRDLAEKCRNRAIPLRRLAELPDDEVVARLIPVHGIGRWTAEMFLIFSLGRLDVLPVADFGLRAGVRNHYKLPDLPGKDELIELGEPWRPYRSIATWFFWRSLGNVPQSDRVK